MPRVAHGATRMSLDFMVVSGERSGSTWVANWLTTDSSICFHDPRLRWTEQQICHLSVPRKRVGICCTYAGIDPEWANRQNVPTLVLHRDPQEVEASWRRIGVVPFVSRPPLDCVAGWHVDWRAPRDPKVATEIYEFLLWKPIDLVRHQELVQMNIQPHFTGLTHGKASMEELTRKITESMNK